MSVGLLIITHNEVGRQLMLTAKAMLGGCPLPCDALGVRADSDPDEAMESATNMLHKVDQGDGVLVLTDMYGSTPSNIANRLRQRENVRVVAGVNLPMLVRVLNYPRLNLEQLEMKALSGGRDGVMPCKHEG